VKSVWCEKGFEISIIVIFPFEWKIRALRWKFFEKFGTTENHSINEKPQHAKTKNINVYHFAHTSEIVSHYCSNVGVISKIKMAQFNTFIII
jgi:hypothetical protein